MSEKRLVELTELFAINPLAQELIAEVERLKEHNIVLSHALEKASNQ